MRSLRTTAKPFLTLVRNEWREVRTLTIVCALLVPAALLAIDVGFLDWRGDFAGTYFVPSVIALFLAVIASDIVAADVATGRAKTLACLPVSASLRWFAKIVFLLLAGAGFAAWTLAVTAALYETLAPSAQVALLYEHLGRLPLLWGWGAAAVVGATVLWSTVLERGFAAIGGAIVMCAMLAGVIPLIAMHDIELLPVKAHYEIALVCLPLVFLVASYVAFVRGPVHAGSLLRRAALATGVLAAVLVPVGSVWAAVLVDRLDVEPGDPDVDVYVASVSPDGEYAVVIARKRQDYARNRVWMLRLADGQITPLPGKGQEVVGDPWSARASTRGTVRLGADDAGEPIFRDYDIDSGSVVRTRSLEQLRAEGCDPYAGHASRVPGITWTRRSDTLEIRNVEAGTVRLVEFPTRITWVQPSPSGEYVRVWAGRGRFVVDVRAARIVLDDSGYPTWPGGGSDDRYVLLREIGLPTVFDLQTGTRLDPPNVVDWWANPRFLSERFWLLTSSYNEIRLVDREEGTERIVYAPR